MARPEKVEDVTKNSPSQIDFLWKVGEDEPIFILRGRDALAVPTIHAWIEAARAEGVNLQKVESATAHMAMFIIWQRTNATKLPD